MVEERRDHKIYKYTNKVNGKVYIGRTCQTLEARANGSGKGYKYCTYFYNAIKKYGWDSFEGEILEEGLNDKEAGKRELYYINLFDSTNGDKGYNLRDSDYRTYKDETREKMRIAQTGKKLSEEARRKISESNRRRGMPESLKKKLLAANTGRKPTPETTEKIRQGNLGKVISQETREKISKNLKGKMLGDKHPNWGKKMSEEQKEKLRKYHAGLHLSEETKKKLSEATKGKGCVKIQCVETKMEYSSIREASELTGIKNGTISYALRSGGTGGGYHWTYLGEPRESKRNTFTTKVKCVETGVIYKSIKEASECTGINSNSIAVASRSEGFNTAGNLHWERIEIPAGTKIRRGGKKVECIETGKIFSSLSEADESIGRKKGAVSASIKNGHKAGGFHWRYADEQTTN